jgi:hypothetical protein
MNPFTCTVLPEEYEGGDISSYAGGHVINSKDWFPKGWEVIFDINEVGIRVALCPKLCATVLTGLILGWLLGGVDFDG